jgi:hypothetical protein
MSALGQKRIFSEVCVMSALPPKADIAGEQLHVRFVSAQFHAARVSSERPRLKAFCRVAPSVLFNIRAISAARLLLFANRFNVRMSLAVHARLFIDLLRMEK